VSDHARRATCIAAFAFALLGTAAVAQVSGLQAYASSGPSIEGNRYGPGATGAAPGGPRGSVVVARAQAKIAAGDFLAAQRILQNEVRGAPNAEPLFLSAVAHSGLGELEEARRAFSEALAADAQHVGARVGLALTDIRLGRHDEAAAALADLEARRAACARMCNNVVALERGVRVIDHFLEQPLRL
jgi:thioredoxin-like negative regulator of GroEL